MSFHSSLMDYFADLSREVLRLFFHSLDASKSITSSLHLLSESCSRPNKGKLLLNIEVVFHVVHYCMMTKKLITRMHISLLPLAKWWREGEIRHS